MKFLFLIIAFAILPFKVSAFDMDSESHRLQRQKSKIIRIKEKTEVMKQRRCVMIYDIYTDALKYKAYYDQHGELARFEKYYSTGGKEAEYFYTNGQLICEKLYDGRGKIREIKEYSMEGKVLLLYNRKEGKVSSIKRR